MTLLSIDNPSATGAGHRTDITTRKQYGEITMPNTCSICKHQKLNEINLLLVQGKSLQSIATQFKIGYKSIGRHRICLGESLNQWQNHRDVKLVLDAKAELTHCINRVRKLFDACEAELTDPDHPDKYTLAPAAERIEVTYFEHEGQKRVRRKGLLSVLLARLENQGGLVLDVVKVKPVDASKRLLEASKLLGEQLERMGERFGLFNQTPDKDRLIALRSGVEHIQQRLSKEFGRKLSWNEALDEVLIHNRQTSLNPYLERLREDEDEVISKSVM
jgi:hypothetical protein